MAMGRPREFDVAQVLDRALLVFWRNGYEGASIAELTGAMGINPPSLYAAFGNKEALFRKALDRYAELLAKFWDDAFEAVTARGVVEYLLRESANFLTDPRNPPGCLLVRGALACSEGAEAIQRELNARRDAGVIKLRERLEAAKNEGEIPADLEPDDYARYIMTVIEGMSVRAASGATRADLHKVADTALRTWPA